MAYLTTSNYPAVVDPLIFMQDLNYSKKSVEDTHRNFLQQGQYTLAASYLNSESGITPWTAGLFNLIENRIFNLQTYLKNKSVATKPITTSAEPTTIANATWISDIK